MEKNTNQDKVFLNGILKMFYNDRRYISVADYEAQNCQIIKNLNTRTNDTRNTKPAIEYTCC